MFRQTFRHNLIRWPIAVHLAPLMGLLFLGAASAHAATDPFQGAQPEPIGKTPQAIAQLRIRFPEQMVKNGNQEVIKVTCTPQIAGFSGWADNNTMWTYNFKSDDDFNSPRLSGGSKCHIEQVADVASTNAKTWKTGTISYDVVVAGPNITSVTTPREFQGSLRETQPVVLLTFDGAVDTAKFFSDRDGDLGYISENAPSEKLPLIALPPDQVEKVFSQFKQAGDTDLKFSDRNWILATVSQNLIPGAKVKLSVQNQTSADNADVHADAKFDKNLAVRGQFKADVRCENPSAKTGSCMPQSAIAVVVNGEVKWTDMKKAYIEYIPFKSKDKKRVRSFAEIPSDKKIGLWDSILDRLADYFPFLAKYNDTIVDTVVFNVDIEPLTQAKIVIPEGLTDTDGRHLTNAGGDFRVRIGGLEEMLQTPTPVSFFERNVPGVFLPISIVNQNQKITIRKSGTDSKNWQPYHDVASILKALRAYAGRDDFRTTPAYTSPLVTAGLTSNTVDQTLSGTKNRVNMLQFPFPKVGTAPVSGLYAIEVDSASYDAGQSDPSQHHYFNPSYVLAQVTDLSVHLKKGQTSNLAWVTHLSNAQPVAGAQIEIYNCLGEKKTTLITNASGYVTFPTQTWAADCGGSDSDYLDPAQFYIAATAGDDISVTHSSWMSNNSYALGAPGVEWFDPTLTDNTPHFHAVIGVNLVKPGQQVPIELIANLPTATGFQDVPIKSLPANARIASADDDNTYYEFPLTWVSGKAQIKWQVPADSAVRLGRYTIELPADGYYSEVTSGDIEVAEFKVPLMSGLVAFPNQVLVQPDSIPVNYVIRYANGVGAKNLTTELSYYFTPSSLNDTELPDFSFGTGPVTLTSDDGNDQDDAKSILPTSSRPAVLQGLATGADGSLKKDLALEKASDGRTIADVLKTSTRPQKLVARVRYQDQVGEYQTLSSSKDIFNAGVYVGTSITAGAKTDARLRAAVVDVNSKNVTTLADLSFKLTRIETRVIGEELFGGLIKNTLEKELTPVAWTPNCAIDNAVASCRMTTLKEGSYAFEATSKSSSLTAHSLFKVDTDGRVYGQNDYYDFGDDEGNKQLPLALDKKTYNGGDTAIVSFAPPFKTCDALVTIERSDVMRSFVVADACQKGHVEIKAEDSFAPNAFVSIYAITGRAQSAAPKPGDIDFGRPTYRLGYANLKVNWDSFKADVSVITAKPTYAPGDTVEVQAKVAATKGRLQSTTVTFVALEEKILDLKPNATYAILDAMMGLRGHQVQTVTALERIETVTGVNADTPLSSGRKGGDEGGDGSSKTDFKRKLFNALVAFQADVPVQDGVAKFSFKTNDSLTRFKIFAIATDTGEKFGMGSVEYLTSKDEQTYSNLPTVAHTGDSFPLKVTVQNNSNHAAQYKAEIVVVIKDANGKVIGTKTLSNSARVDTSGSRAIDVGRLDIPDDGASIEYTVNTYDENGKLIDSVQPDAQTILASVPLAIHDSFIHQLINGAYSQSVVKDVDALPGKGELRVTVSNSLVDTAIAQVNARISRDVFADFVIESRFDRALASSSQAKPEKLKAVLVSILNYTDDNGFVKYYPQAPHGSIWLTAKIANALRQEAWTKAIVPPALKDRLSNALSMVLKKSVQAEYVVDLSDDGKASPLAWERAQSFAAQAAFAFPGLIADAKTVYSTINAELHRDANAYGLPLPKWSNGDLVSLWRLSVLADSSNALNGPAYKLLTDSAHLIYAGNLAELKGQPQDSAFYSDETIETAELLGGLSELKANSDLARTLATGLVAANVKGWYNTETMTSVAQSLKAFARGYEADVVTGTAYVNIPEEQTSTSVDFAKANSGDLTSTWTSNQDTVKVTTNGQGQPWVGVQALTAVPLTQARGQGLTIEKTIRNLTRESTGAAATYQAGDIIEITLDIHAATNLRHMALMDPIPSGANILADAYGDFSTGEKSYSGYKMYFDFLSDGKTTVKYQYQLNNPGQFKLPPTHAEGLYLPSVFAETPNATITVQ